MLLPLSLLIAAAIAPIAPIADELVVTATRLSDDPDRQPYAITRLDRDDLDRIDARTLGDRLQGTPGLVIQHTAPNQTSPFVRGLTGEQTLLLFDGVRYSHAAMRPGPNQYAALIADESVSAVDVILGGSAVAAGSDGLTGVLDFRLAPAGRDAAGKAAPWLRSRASTTEGVAVAAGVDGRDGDWAWSLEGSRADFTDLRGGARMNDRLFSDDGSRHDRIPNTAYAQTAYAGRLARDVDGHRLEIAAGRTEQHDAPRPDGYAENSGKPGRISRFFDPQSFGYVHLRHTTTPAAAWLDEARTTLWHHRHAEYQVREDVKDHGTPEEHYRRREYDDAIGVVGADLQLTSRPARDHVLVWGGTWIRERTANAYRELRSPIGDVDPDAAVTTGEADWTTKTTLPDGALYRTVGVHLQDHWSFADRWRLLAGGRWSRHAWEADLSGRGYAVERAEGAADQLTGDLRLSWHPSEGTTLFAGLGQGFRAPNLTNLAGIQDRASSGDPFRGDPDLEPETSLTVEGGWRHVAGADRLSATVFRTRVDDLIQQVYDDVDDDDEPDAYVANAEHATLTGCEIAVYRTLVGGHKRLSLHATLGYVHARVHRPLPDGTVEEQNLSRANRLSGRAALRLDGDGRWFLMPQLRWSAPYDDVAPSDARDVRLTVAGAPDGGMPGYGVVDVVIGLRPAGGRVDATLVLQNLGDRTYRDPGSGVDGPGRGVALAVSFR